VPLAIGTDMAHLVAMAVWTGGLFTLAALALRGPATHAGAAALPRVSAVAPGGVAVLAARGGLVGWPACRRGGGAFRPGLGLAGGGPRLRLGPPPRSGLPAPPVRPPLPAAAGDRASAPAGARVRDPRLVGRQRRLSVSHCRPRRGGSQARGRNGDPRFQP